MDAFNGFLLDVHVSPLSISVCLLFLNLDALAVNRLYVTAV